GTWKLLPLQSLTKILLPMQGRIFLVYSMRLPVFITCSSLNCFTGIGSLCCEQCLSGLQNEEAKIHWLLVETAVFPTIPLLWPVFEPSHTPLANHQPAKTTRNLTWLIDTDME
ncbi:MAG: hypothetical protein R6X34_29465, partial [Chloroflexota bacterium]